MILRLLAKLLAGLTGFGRTVLAGARFRYRLHQGNRSSCQRFVAGLFADREGP
jgi:hypothetical protein